MDINLTDLAIGATATTGSTAIYAVTGADYISNNYTVLIASFIFTIIMWTIVLLESDEKANNRAFAELFLGALLSPPIAMLVHVGIIEIYGLDSTFAAVISVVASIFSVKILKNIPIRALTIVDAIEIYIVKKIKAKGVK